MLEMGFEEQLDKVAPGPRSTTRLLRVDRGGTHSSLLFQISGTVRNDRQVIIFCEGKHHRV